MPPPIHLKRVRITLGIEHIFIAADGETHEDGVRETLDNLVRLCEALTTSGIPHETFERKTADGGYELDTVKLPREYL